MEPSAFLGGQMDALYSTDCTPIGHPFVKLNETLAAAHALAR